MRFQFIDEHRAEFSVALMCRVLAVSPSGYYAWRKRPVSAQKMANQELGKKIEVVYNDHYGIYGSPRIYRVLQQQGVVCSRKRVARLMRERGLRARQARRYKATTRRKQGDPVAPNRLKQHFQAERPNQTWLSDITYIPTGEGWLYLAVVLDLFSRRIVGWAMSGQMTGDLTVAALQMALCQRQPATNLLHHSDQGSQYTAGAYQTLLKSWGIQVSMNGVGSWYDNAPLESFFGSLKQEWVHHRSYRARDEARVDLFYYIEAFYNRRRLHSALDYLSPEAYEQLFHQQQNFP